MRSVPNLSSAVERVHLVDIVADSQPMQVRSKKIKIAIGA